MHHRLGVLVSLGALFSVGLAVAAGGVGAVAVTDEPGFRTAWLAGTSPIDLNADITLTCTNGGGNGVATTSSASVITVNGNGHVIRQTCTTGTNNGVLVQNGAGALTFDSVTITGGNTASGGGGILAGAASVTLNNSTITGNTAAGGGAIATNSAVTLTSSTISNNVSTLGDGGGIAAFGATVTLTDSTVSGNHADNVGGNSGGGIADAATVILTRSTVSGNTASSSGGGITAGSTVTLTNSTVTGNTAFNEGGINVAGIGSASLVLVYSTVAGNTALGSGANAANVGRVSVGTTTLTSFGSVIALPLGTSRPNCGNITTTSNGFNFSDDATCAFTATGDHQNAGDPGLGALAGNGGPTQTRQPQLGSPLIDAIPLASCQADGASGVTVDQRGVTRPQGVGCDIGAVEVQPVTPPTAPAAAAVITTLPFTG